MIKRLALIAGLLLGLASPLAAQQVAKVVASCGSASYTAGTTNYVTVDTTGNQCGSSGGGSGGSVTQGTSPWVVAGSGAAGTANAGVVTVQGITSMTPVQVSQATAATLNATVIGTGTFATQATPTASTTGGASVSSKQVANNTTSVAIDASAGTLYGVTVFNNSATIAYLKLYNASQGSTTCGSGTPVQRILIPASTAGSGATITFPVGVAYSTAITSCVTTGYADNDATAPAASAYLLEFYYK